MPYLIPLNICFAITFYSMFISAYHREKFYLFHLLLFFLNALVALYAIFYHFGLLK